MRLAIDDFGTGYSSLSYLQTSRSTSSRSTDPSSTSLGARWVPPLARGIVELGRALG